MELDGALIRFDDDRERMRLKLWLDLDTANLIEVTHKSFCFGRSRSKSNGNMQRKEGGQQIEAVSCDLFRFGSSYKGRTSKLIEETSG